MKNALMRAGARLFPPPIGWIPVIVGLFALVALSVWGIAPQFATHVTEKTTQNSQLVAVSGSAGTSGQVISTSGPAGKGGGGAGTVAAGIKCAGGQNGGASDTGVSAGEVHVASTIVTTGIGSGFLGEAVNGMQAAVNEANQSGGICGRRLTLETINTDWQPDTGNQDITSYINSGKVFALVGEPDSEGLAGAIDSGTISRAGIPVVGTDGMLRDQYLNPWVWPIAASTVTNAHIIAKYAVDTLHAQSFGIVYDTRYRFGAEGAAAFDAEVARLTGSHIPGSDKQGCPSGTHFCGIDASKGSYSDEITAFNNGCKPCGVVLMLLEPSPMQAWMSGEKNATDAQGNPTWYRNLFGGEPLFDDHFASLCAGQCGKMTVWTGYHAAIPPFDAEPAVYTYSQSLKSVCPSCDPHNEFTEGAYMGTRLFVDACRRLQAKGQLLTRANLRDELNSDTFDFGLAANPLRFGSALPRVANHAMAAFSDNASGSFNDWQYLATGFLADPALGQDIR